jgi:hypothetical protein
MMDAASAAAMSDPDRNPHFRRRWGQPPMPRVVPVHQPPDGILGAIGIALIKASRRDRSPRMAPEHTCDPAETDTRPSAAVRRRGK